MPPPRAAPTNCPHSVSPSFSRGRRRRRRRRRRHHLRAVVVVVVVVVLAVLCTFAVCDKNVVLFVCLSLDKK